MGVVAAKPPQGASVAVDAEKPRPGGKANETGDVVKSWTVRYQQWKRMMSRVDTHGDARTG